MHISWRHGRAMPAPGAVVTALAGSLMFAVPALAHAQGSLGSQGFGYPLGGQSARSLGAGGAISGTDAQTTLNPAAIVMNSRAQVYAQYEPEFRTVTIRGVATKTTTSRFPLFALTGRQGKATFSLSFASFMDRTWVNTYADTQTVGTERLASTVLTQSVGGISEGRAAMAWSFSDNVHLGVGLHVYPGQNRVSIGRVFSDSSRAGNFQVSDSYSFSGKALSLGALVIPGKHFVLTADLRVGGGLSMRLGDSTLVGQGTVPLRYGVSASYDGVPGAVFSGRIGGDHWSDLRGLGSPSLGLKDATDMSVGAELAGPRVSGTPVLFRGGYRTRGLPFTYGTNAVKESSMSGGVGIPLIGGRAVIDVGAVNSTRSSGGVSEKSLLLSIGVGIRP